MGVEKAGSGKEERLKVSEASKVTGLSKRVLQYYEEIGLFRPTGRTMGGARYYSKADLVRLEQITFYTDLGIPLDNIRGLLEQQGELTEVNVLETQAMLLYSRIEHRQTQLAALQAYMDVEKQGLKPSWLTLTKIIGALPDADLQFWKDHPIAEGNRDVLGVLFESADQAWDFYYAWKRLIIRAAVYREAGVQPGDWLAQKLGADWKSLVQPLLARSPQMESVFETLRQGQSWLNESYYQDIDRFIEAILSI
ncbi:MAG TPA: MerR family transcriptional regulator [Bellilinea sp.]|nr:MerR family transcriptional regulator [Bellilinea sp.]